MEIIDRKDNPLLNRVEMRFVWNHEGKATPTRREMVEAAAKSEPNANEGKTLLLSSIRYPKPQSFGRLSI